MMLTGAENSTLKSKLRRLEEDNSKKVSVSVLHAEAYQFVSVDFFHMYLISIQLHAFYTHISDCIFMHVQFHMSGYPL